MKIEYKKLRDIKPYLNNPRVNEGAIEAVAQSIHLFGFKVPIIIDKSGEIVAGHTRYEAAKRIGLTEVPTITAGDLTPQQIREFRIVDNLTAEKAAWDFDRLYSELDSLSEMHAQLELMGFEIDSLEMFGPATLPEPAEDAEEYTEVKEEPGKKEPAEPKPRKYKKYRCTKCGKVYEEWELEGCSI